jgi:hypothetical protein
MSILEEIIDRLKPISKIQNMNQRGDFTAGMSIIEGKSAGEVEIFIESVLDSYLKGGEKIVSRLNKGEILDSGKARFKILGGYVVEFYDYETTTSVFIRNYRISDDIKEWIAVYIDQNMATPWWDKGDLS